MATARSRFIEDPPLAGAVSTNPILFALGSLLVLAWKTAGWWGADRLLLRSLGTPWQPGEVRHAALAPKGSIS
jgi:hypothetical protein